MLIYGDGVVLWIDCFGVGATQVRMHQMCFGLTLE